MLDLRNVLQLVKHCLDNRPLPQHQAITQAHQAILHVASKLGDELYACCLHQLRSQLLRDIAFVRKDLAKEPLQQVGNRSPVIGIARS